MAGIHIHPHDILDEGCSQIIRFLDHMRDMRHVFVQVNTIFERNPYPVGTLPHNPVHPVVQGQGTLHVPLHGELDGSRLYQRIDPSIMQGADPMMDFKRATEGSRYEVIPWVNLLNGDFQGEWLENAVIDFRGDPVEHWLCPNGPDVVPMWAKMLSAISERYGYRTFLIDRIRFPDWAGKEVRPSNMFSCFCPRCASLMKEAGIEPDELIKQMEEVSGMLAQGQFQQAVTRIKPSSLFSAFFAFRQDSVTRMVERLLAELNKQDQGIELWLDLWPPAYAWFLGQHYEQLTRLSGTLKHFPYHKLGGGADVQGLVEYFAASPKLQEDAFQAFKQFFELDYSVSYEQFKRAGYPIEFVARENERVRALSQPGTFIFSGVQMWNLTVEELKEAMQAAQSSAADDLLFYCYGWADEALLLAAGE